MKNLFKILFVLIAFGYSLSSNAQSSNNKNSVLWEVSGNGLKKPSYLFGTIHMICGKDFVMWPKATDAFAKTSKLALEINMADPNEMATAQQMAMGKAPLSTTLTAKQKADLESILQKNGVGTLAQLDSYTLETVMSLLFMKSFGCPDLKFYEMEFITKAHESNKPVVGLEKVAEQLEFLNQSFSDDEMIAYLQQIDANMCAEMVKQYTNQDVDGLYQMMIEKDSMSTNTQKILLDNRNAKWVKTMPEMMQQESVFFAFGAAHLAGEKGVINLLKQAGYSLRPIMN
ncbi:TraB/GumN family protein [Flavobacterium sp.]|uniref:TraB/GumN family protein n=1 Tax=Flavobacterium sp. TaxID=239 RepID=UPI00260B5E91|nr:TraB/GumN family protein [Flavobacterium sp.]